MKFIALHSDTVDMKLVSDYVIDIGMTYIARDIEELYEKVKESIETVNFYKILFVYPSKEPSEVFKLIKDIRKMEENLENKIHIVLFVDSKKGVHLLNTISMSNESFLDKNIVKRRLLEVIEGIE